MTKGSGKRQDRDLCRRVHATCMTLTDVFVSSFPSTFYETFSTVCTLCCAFESIRRHQTAEPISNENINSSPDHSCHKVPLCVWYFRFVGRPNKLEAFSTATKKMSAFLVAFVCVWRFSMISCIQTEMYALGLHVLSNVISMVNVSPFHFVDAQARFHFFCSPHVFYVHFFCLLFITFWRSLCCFFPSPTKCVVRFGFCAFNLLWKMPKEMWFLDCSYKYCQSEQFDARFCVQTFKLFHTEC